MSHAFGGPVPARAIHLNELREIANPPYRWRPVRREFGFTGFGVAVFSAHAAGDPLIEPHDETSPGSGGHEELYVVLGGRARFTLGEGDVHDAPTGTFIAVPPGVSRRAEACEPETHVLVIGGRPGAALPVSPFEHWYAALEPLAAGDAAGAADLASQGLVDHPHHAQLNYQVACFAALAGQRDRAIAHLRRALDAGGETIWDWLSDDADLDSLRDDPDFPRPES